MSSSDSAHPSRTYLALMGLGLCCVSVVALILTYLVDPFGLLSSGQPTPFRLCSKGSKTRANNRDFIPLLIQKHQPNTVVMGSSRVRRGFSSSQLPPQAVNVSLRGLTLPEASIILLRAAENPRLKTVWLGLDYGMFFHDNAQTEKIQSLMAAAEHPWTAFRYGLLQPSAIRAAFSVLLGGESCSVAYRNEQGFENPGVASYPILNQQDLKQRKAALANFYRQSASVGDTTLQARYQQRMAMFSGLVDRFATQKIQLNLFVNPSHPAYYEALDDVGLTSQYREWIADLEMMTANADPELLTFIDFSDRYRDPSQLPAECTPRLTIDCPFFDLTHYRRFVGHEIVAAFLEPSTSKK